MIYVRQEAALLVTLSVLGKTVIIQLNNNDNNTYI